MNEQTRKEYEKYFDIIPLFPDAEMLWNDGDVSFYVLTSDGIEHNADSYNSFEEIKVEVDNGALIGLEKMEELQIDKYSNAMENYFQNVIKKSWTWEKLTEVEQQRFIDMDVFDRIRGTDKQCVEWLNTIYSAFLHALDYKSIGWREEVEALESY